MLIPPDVEAPRTVAHEGRLGKRTSRIALCLLLCAEGASACHRPERGVETVDIAPPPSAQSDAPAPSAAAPRHALEPEPSANAHANDAALSDPAVAQCCAALRQTANAASPADQPMYMVAAATCDAARLLPAGRSSLAQVRAVLSGRAAPAACR